MSVDVVLLIDDRTLRGYTRLALLHSDYQVEARSADELTAAAELPSDGAIVVDQGSLTRVAGRFDAALLARTVLVGEGESTTSVFAHVPRMDAERIVQAVRECIKSQQVVEVAEPPAPPPPAPPRRKRAAKPRKTRRK